MRQYMTESDVRDVTVSVLNEQASLSVKSEAKHQWSIVLSVDDEIDFFKDKLIETDRANLRQSKEVSSRLKFLRNVRLQYLTLSVRWRRYQGEAQRRSV